MGDIVWLDCRGLQAPDVRHREGDLGGHFDAAGDFACSWRPIGVVEDAYAEWGSRLRRFSAGTYPENILRDWPR